jgi:hypothetical protein
MAEAKQSIQLAYIAEYSGLEAAIYDEWPHASVFDTEAIMAALAANLDRYRRAPGDAFMGWATAWVRRQARRYRFLAIIRAEFPKLIYSASARAMSGCPADDAAIGVADAEQELYAYLLENPRLIDSLMRPSKAKPSTRLYSLVRAGERNRRKLLTDRLHIVINRVAAQNITDNENKLVAA